MKVPVRQTLTKINYKLVKIQQLTWYICNCSCFWPVAATCAGVPGPVLVRGLQQAEEGRALLAERKQSSSTSGLSSV